MIITNGMPLGGYSHIDNEGVGDGGENLLLIVDMLHLLQPDDLADGHDL